MRDYIALQAELEAKGFSEIDAAKIIHFVEVEDMINERLHANECRDKARMLKAFKEYWAYFFKLEEKYKFAWWNAAMHVGEQKEIEWEQRTRLLDTGQREKSIFLASILKYFCKLEDWQIVLIVGLRESQNRASGDVMNMPFV